MAAMTSHANQEYQMQDNRQSAKAAQAIDGISVAIHAPSTSGLRTLHSYNIDRGLVFVRICLCNSLVHVVVTYLFSFSRKPRFLYGKIYLVRTSSKTLAVNLSLSLGL